MDKVISKDGTAIAYERSGTGPALVLVDGAMCSMTFGPSEKFAAALSKQFTVYRYDRRGRGASGDTLPYAKAREVEDLAALVEAAGGTAAVLGFSSGAALALEAAASGVPFTKVVAYEPPFMPGEAEKHRQADHPAQVRKLVAAGKRKDAVAYFMRDMVGMPGIVVGLLRVFNGKMFRQLEPIAHTIAYDAEVMGDWEVPAARLAAIRAPTAVMYGTKTFPRIKDAAKAAAPAIPGAKLESIEGISHDAKPEILAPVVTTFLAA